MQSLQNVLVLQERENKSGGRERKEQAETKLTRLKVGCCAALGRFGGAPWEEQDKTSSRSLGTAFLLRVGNAALPAGAGWQPPRSPAGSREKLHGTARHSSARLQELDVAGAASQPPPILPMCRRRSRRRCPCRGLCAAHGGTLQATGCHGEVQTSPAACSPPSPCAGKTQADLAPSTQPAPSPSPPAPESSLLVVISAAAASAASHLCSASGIIIPGHLAAAPRLCCRPATFLRR